MKRQYVDNDEKRKTARTLNDHADSLTKEVQTAVTEATILILDRQKAHMLRHEEMVAATHDHLAEASRIYREAVDKQVDSFHRSSQSSVVLAQDLKVEANKVREKVLSIHFVSSLKLVERNRGLLSSWRNFNLSTKVYKDAMKF
jgi:hypothetical protein